MTVYVVHPVSDDIKAAEQWGRIDYVNHRYINGDELNGENLPPEFVLQMEQAVAEFNTEHDYLLIVGDHLQLIQMTALLIEEHGHFRVLRWDRRERAYFPAMISVGG